MPPKKCVNVSPHSVEDPYIRMAVVCRTCRRKKEYRLLDSAVWPRPLRKNSSLKILLSCRRCAKPIGRSLRTPFIYNLAVVKKGEKQWQSPFSSAKASTGDGAHKDVGTCSIVSGSGRTAAARSWPTVVRAVRPLRSPLKRHWLDRSIVKRRQSGKKASTSVSEGGSPVAARS